MRDSIEKTIFEKVTESAYIGSSRVVFTFGAGHPFDLVKTQMQANPNIHSAVLLSQEIYQKTGIRGFYTGGLPNFSRHFLKEIYRSPQRGFTKNFLGQNLPEFPGKKDFVNTSTGLVMATTDTFIICPLERLKVWMMTNYSNNKKFNLFFKAIPNTNRIVSELFRGLKVSFVRSGMTWTSYLLAEERIRAQIKKLSPRVQTTEVNLPLAEQLLVGTLSGIINCFCTLPFDAVKTQMQKKDHVSSTKITEVMHQIYSKHGMRGLYTGWQARLPHYAIVGALTSHVLHEVDKIWSPKR